MSMEQEKTESTTEQKPSGPVTFTPEQQEFFNKTLNAKYSDWRKKSEEKEKQYDTRIQELEAKLTTLAPVAQGSPKSAEGGLEGDDVKQLKDQLMEARRVIELGKAKEEAFLERQKALQLENENRRGELLNERKSNALINLATKHKFMNPDHVIKIVGEQIKYHPDTDNFRVYGENGEERYNDQLKHMSLDEFMGEFAAKNPHMVRGAQIAGTGATEATRAGGKKWTRAEISNLSKADYEKYRTDIVKAYAEGRVVGS